MPCELFTIDLSQAASREYRQLFSAHLRGNEYAVDDEDHAATSHGVLKHRNPFDNYGRVVPSVARW